MKIDSNIIKTYKAVHTWTGIIAGLALFIAFYAGSMTVFKDSLSRWASPPGMGSVEDVSLLDAPQLIADTIAAHPEAARQLRLNLHPSENLSSRISWEVRNPESHDHGSHENRHYTATLNTDSGYVSQEVHPSQLAEFIDTLHRVVGLPFDTEENRWFMGVIAVLYTLALVSGLIVLLPTLVKDFFALRLGKNLKRMWLDAHNVVGIASLPFHLVMALTSIAFAFHDPIYDVQDQMFHDGELSEIFRPAVPPPPPDQPTDPTAMLPPLEIVARAKALSPSFEPYMLHYIAVNTPRAQVRVWGHDMTGVMPRYLGGFVPINPYTGEALSLEFMPGLQSDASTTISSFFALHMALYGGDTVRWIYFILGLSGAWLFYTGNLLWVESRRKKQRRDKQVPIQRKDTSIMASLTVGVSLGCISGISASIAAAKWLNGYVDDLTSWHMIIYYVLFFTGIAWAFLRGPGRAAVELLWFAVVTTLFIPLASLLAWIMPGSHLWVHLSPATLGVDITALFMAVCFSLMATATARRVYGGRPEDSLWHTQGKTSHKNVAGNI